MVGKVEGACYKHTQKKKECLKGEEGRRRGGGGYLSRACRSINSDAVDGVVLVRTSRVPTGRGGDVP